MSRLVHRRHPQALRSLRLARDPVTSGPDPVAINAADRRPRPHRQADADLLQDHHRRRRAQQGRTATTCMAPAGPPRSPPPAPTSAGPTPLRDPGRRRGLGRRLPRAPPLERNGTPRKFAAYRAALPGSPPSSAPHGRRAARPTGSHVAAAIAQVVAKAETIATRKASQNAIEAWRPAARNSSAARPTSPAPT